uniref:Uncharacterized protein n=1 Tax=Strongyloides venezuelensis TaxID=75913 RepID=A0A0K0EZ25_STRVS
MYHIHIFLNFYFNFSVFPNSRRSTTVGPSLKIGRTVPTNRLRDVNNPPKDHGRLRAGERPRVNVLRRIAGQFEEMIDVISDEVKLHSLENHEGKNIQLPPEKLELVNSIQTQIIKESLDSGLSYKIPAIRKLTPMLNIGKKIIDFDTRISDAVELNWTLHQKAEKLANEEMKNASDLKHLQACKHAIDKFIREVIYPTLATIESQKELLKAADTKIVEIATMFEGFAGYKF